MIGGVIPHRGIIKDPLVLSLDDFGPRKRFLVKYIGGLRACLALEVWTVSGSTK